MDSKEQSNTTNDLHHHFAHQHPLNRTVSSENVTCNGCTFEISPGNDFYACETCNSFSLHKLCFHLPQTTAHPAHPDESLNLSVISQSQSQSQSSSPAPKCRACTKTIAAGFYYGCGGGGGGNCYHNLCLTLPLSVTVSGHPHPLKIQFSPPYDFSCDLCAKPSYKGWLYRCRFCEFDAHIACAISHKTSDPAALPENLTRQISNSAKNGREILQLLQLRLGIPIPGENLTADEDRKELAPAASNSPPSSPPPPPRTPSTPPPKSPLSSVADIPSYQFSDLCFSIDLHKSFSGPDGGERKLVVGTPVPSPASAGSTKNWCDSHALLQSSTNGKIVYKEEKKVMNAYGVKKKSAIHECDEETKCSCWSRVMMLCCGGGERKKCLKCSANR
ncbi:hypothetical protein LINGRAHAP2_LOCUS36008 [Linum grandiflorum]